MATIPASLFVSVNPSVIAAGGNAIDVIGLLLTTSYRVPIGAVQSFADAGEVANRFGAGSVEAALAATYFSGFDNSNVKPGSVLFAQYPSVAVGAYLQSGDVSALTLAELQALSGSLSVTFDGYVRPAPTVDLAAATSFSSAAALIEAALNAVAPNEAEVTGSIAGTTLTVTAVTSGTLAAGQTVAGTGGEITAGTIILSQLTGSAGGTGTYEVGVSQTVGPITIIASATPLDVSYDSVAGAFLLRSGITGAESTGTYATGTLAASIKLTAATGAVLSQGADAAVPATFMDAVLQQTTNWVTFMTTFDPDASGSTVKQAFAAWNSGKNNRYAYICFDTDPAPAAADPAATSLGQILDANGNSGTCLVWTPDATAGAQLAAFVCGAAASIDFTQTQGRITFAYKSQSAITATVTDGDVATNLGGTPQNANRGNGYNYYGAVGAANADFVWFQRGFVTGDFAWLDSYINQIWLNNACQLALLTLLTNMRSIPYNVAGNALIEAALADPIQAALIFGAFAPGTISAAQIAAVNASAGRDVSVPLQTQGYYLQVLQASSAVRAARGSPPCTLWYLDRGSVQAINLSSVAVQ